MAQRLKILIVEDHTLMQEAFTALLADIGDVFAASTPQAALQEFERHPDTSVVIISLLTPSVDDTIKLIERIHAPGSTPILLLANEDDTDRQPFRNAANREFLHEVFWRGALRTELHRILKFLADTGKMPFGS